MLSFFEWVFAIVVFLFAIPVLTFSLQIMVALLPNKIRVSRVMPQVSVVILIPAHNESSGILPTLASINAQVSTNVKVLVVADNCSDDTAVVARSMGVEVIERFNASQRGKGYALDFGIKYLFQQAPDVVLILDADCLLGKNTISNLVSDAIHYQRPVQGLYLMHAKSEAALKIKIAEFAWLVKNWVRPLGFYRLGLPCQLMGSGMAFPWAAIQKVDLASGHIVEDMKLGVDLAKLNLAPKFCPEALISSYFPTSEEGIQTQRIRWEHGHIGMIVKEGPLLMLQSVKQLNFKMLALALDMCVPPLALLVLMIVVLSGLSLALILLTAQLLPWVFAIINLFLLGITVMLAWFKFGRSILSFNKLMMAPVYVLVKIPLYIKFIFKRQSEWVRSKRDL